jgi:hypothetical protein
VSSASRLTATLAALALAFVLVPVGQADGDPASDYLLSQQTFLPFDAKIPATLAEKLNGLVRETNQAGYKIRVAIIATRYDLGAVTALWLQPKRYARFLSAELAFVYKGPLLIVMPNGLGFHARAGATAAGYRAIAPVHVAPGVSGIMQAAIAAVKRLATAHGVKVQPPNVAPAAKRNHGDRIRILIGVGGLVAVLALAVVVRRLRRGRYPRGASG